MNDEAEGSREFARGARYTTQFLVFCAFVGAVAASEYVMTASLLTRTRLRFWEYGLVITQGTAYGLVLGSGLVTAFWLFYGYWRVCWEKPREQFHSSQRRSA